MNTCSAIAWSNGLGYNVRIDEDYYEVWEHGGIRWLLPAPATATGFVGTYHHDGDRTRPASATHAIELVARALQDSAWYPCEGLT